MEPAPAQRRFVLHLMAATFVASLFVYGLAVFVATREREPRAVDPAFASTLALVALGCLAGSFLAERALRERMRGTAMAWIAPWVVGTALREACAVFGLVLAFVAVDARWYAAFAVPAVAAMLLAWPRQEHA